MSGLMEGLLSLHGWLALALICVLPGLEAPAFLGLILPGELALVLGGVLAHEGRVSLPAAIVVGRSARSPATRSATGSGIAGATRCSPRRSAAHVMLGYATGEGWRRVHHLAGRGRLLVGVTSPLPAHQPR